MRETTKIPTDEKQKINDLEKQIYILTQKHKEDIDKLNNDTIVLKTEEFSKSQQKCLSDVTNKLQREFDKLLEQINKTHKEAFDKLKREYDIKIKQNEDLQTAELLRVHNAQKSNPKSNEKEKYDLELKLYKAEFATYKNEIKKVLEYSVTSPDSDLKENIFRIMFKMPCYGYVEISYNDAYKTTHHFEKENTLELRLNEQGLYKFDLYLILHGILPDVEYEKQGIYITSYSYVVY